jgi:hypothetical protein
MSKQKSFPTQDVVAAAIAAYEFNKNTIVRDTFEKDGVKTLSNRELITLCLNKESAPFVVNDFYIKQAEGAVEYLQQVTVMQTLQNGKVDKFLENIVKLLVGSDVKGRDIGILAWVPKLADDYQKKDHVREVSARYEHGSRFVGRVGEKIIIDFNLIESRYIKTLECYAVYGNDNAGNLIFYWARDQKKIFNNVRVQGRVKTQQKDSRRGNASVTTINYVKVL